MNADAANSLSAFGFLTVLEDPQHGFFGGYLVLSDLGRPLEFHCSTPVLPNQAQRILYGATLRPYVLGEIIGQTLIAKARLAVQAVVTDMEEMLSVALFREELVAYLTPGEMEANQQPTEFCESELTLGSYRLTGASSCAWQPEQLAKMLTPLCAHVDLSEPFERIRDAIREAQRITEPQADDEHAPSEAA